jgi:hypothetical protein
MTDRTAELQALLDKNAEAKCVQFFASSSEAERRDLAKLAVPLFKQANKIRRMESGVERDPRLPAAQIAVLATGSLSELKQLGWQAVPDAKAAFAVLTNRRTSWLTEYADYLLSVNPLHWPLVRTLVRQGHCRRPSHANYTLGMIRTIGEWRLAHLHVEPPGKTVLANLRTDAELLKREVWEVFQVEGEGELSLAGHDKFSGGGLGHEYSWSGALEALAKTGELSRDRLLDESLEALNRGFSQFRVAWFSQFHELLEPTVTERLKRQEKYLVLLASSIPPTVTFALDALDIIDKERPLPAAEMIESLQPVLFAKHKGTAKRAVQWLDKLAARDAKCQPIAASAAAQALAHEAVDVQKAAIDVIVKYGPPGDASLRKQVAQSASGVAASLRKRLDAWLGGGAAEPKRAKSAKLASKSESGPADLDKQVAAIPSKWAKLAGIPPLLVAAKEGRIEITALEIGPLDVPRLDPAAALQPVKDLDEWIDVSAHFVETPEEIDEGERILEGLSRYCDQSPEDLPQLGPLKKRIDKLYQGNCGPFMGSSLRDDVCGIVRAWFTGQVVRAEPKRQQHGNTSWTYSDKDSPLWGEASALALWSLTYRSLELAERAKRRTARPLLSAATHRGGWLDPLIFAERLLAWDKLGDQPPHYDVILALLRLAPDNRALALKRLGKVAGELGDAARYALSADKPALGKTAALWIAAARARAPLADDPWVDKQFPNLGPGAGQAARYRWAFKPESLISSGTTYHFVRYHLNIEPSLPGKVEKDLPTVLLNHRPRFEESGDAAEIRWQGSIWPAGRESFFVRGTRRLANNVDWSEAEWGNKTYLQPLLDPEEPLGELARVALCLGLSAKDPGEHTLAADVLAGAIKDGRVDGQVLAPTLAKLLTTANVKPGRWAKVFGSVARISRLHACIVRRMLENTLAAAAKALSDPPKDLHLVLELLIELLAESGAVISSPAVRDALSKITGTGKAAKAAKALLAAKQDENTGSDSDVMRSAIQGRIDRARRWAGRSS